MTASMAERKLAMKGERAAAEAVWLLHMSAAWAVLGSASDGAMKAEDDISSSARSKKEAPFLLLFGKKAIADPIGERSELAPVAYSLSSRQTVDLSERERNFLADQSTNNNRSLIYRRSKVKSKETC